MCWKGKKKTTERLTYEEPFRDTGTVFQVHHHGGRLCAFLQQFDRLAFYSDVIILGCTYYLLSELVGPVGVYRHNGRQAPSHASHVQCHERIGNVTDGKNAGGIGIFLFVPVAEKTVESGKDQKDQFNMLCE